MMSEVLPALPDHIWKAILAQLDLDDRARASATCRLFKDLASPGNWSSTDFGPVVVKSAWLRRLDSNGKPLFYDFLTKIAEEVTNLRLPRLSDEDSDNLPVFSNVQELSIFHIPRGWDSDANCEVIRSRLHAKFPSLHSLSVTFWDENQDGSPIAEMFHLWPAMTGFDFPTNLAVTESMLDAESGSLEPQKNDRLRAICERLSRSKSLHIFIGGNNMSYDLLKDALGQAALEQVHFDFSVLDETVVVDLCRIASQVTSLVRVSLNGVYMNFSYLCPLFTGLPQLKTLAVQGVDIVNKSEFSQAFQNAVCQLEVLRFDIFHNGLSSEELLDPICENMPRLRSLSVSGLNSAKKARKSAFRSLKSLKHLKFLTLNPCAHRVWDDLKSELALNSNNNAHMKSYVLVSILPLGQCCASVKDKHSKKEDKALSRVRSLIGPECILVNRSEPKPWKSLTDSQKERLRNAPEIKYHYGWESWISNLRIVPV